MAAESLKAVDRLFRWGWRRAYRPERVHSFAFEAFCHTLCAASEITWSQEDREEWDWQNEELARKVIDTVERDPGRRILLVVRCQRAHRLRALLKKEHRRMELVDYREL